MPRPKRDDKGYRLYSERDVAVTRWLKERVQHGVGISRAIHMYRMLEQQSAIAEAPQTYDLDALKHRLVVAIEALDEVTVNQVISEALIVASIETVSLSLLQPALYEVGELWRQGQLSVTCEHFGSNLVRSQLAQLIRLSPPPLRQGQIMVGAAPGEAHDIGALILCLFLRRRGFEVLYLGANPEMESLVADVVRLQPSAVCLSASSREAAAAIGIVYERLRPRYAGLLGFGGRIFNDDEAQRERTEGTFLGDDAESASSFLARALTESSLALA